MSTTKALLGVIPTLQAASLLGYNAKLLDKTFRLRPKKPSFRKMNRNLVKAGVGTLIGVSLIGATSEAINKID